MNPTPSPTHPQNNKTKQQQKNKQTNKQKTNKQIYKAKQNKTSMYGKTFRWYFSIINKIR